MRIPPPWRSFFIIGPPRSRDAERRTLAGRVAAAIASANARAGKDLSLNDISGPGGFPDFAAKEQAAASAFKAARDAAQLVSEAGEGPFADPVLTAAIRLFPPPPGVDPAGHAERVIDLHRAIAGLLVDEGELPSPPPKLGRGRQSNHDPVLEAVVRAAMHDLHERGRPRSGGWRYKDRDIARNGKRSTEAELGSAGAAEYVRNAVRGAGVRATAPQIKKYMVAFTKILRQENRAPVEKDYIYDYFP